MIAIRRRALAATVGLLAAATVAAPAEAKAENVLTAISSQSKMILASRAEQTAHHLQTGTLAQERTAVPVYRALAKAFDHAASVAAAATASTAKQRTGQHEWVTGMHDFAIAYRNLAKAFQDLSVHNSTGAETLLGQTHAIITSALKDTNRAYQRLGISSGGL